MSAPILKAPATSVSSEPQVPADPQGIQNPQCPNGLSAYGGLYQAGTQLVIFTQPDAYVQVRLNSQLPLRNVLANGSNGLVIQEDGDYEIFYNLLISTSDAVNVGFGVRRDGIILPTTRGSQRLAVESTTTTSYDGRLLASSIAALPAGSVLDLVVSVLGTLPPNLDAAISGYANATLTVKKL